MNYLVYDVEVVNGPDEVEGGWNNPEGMGFATAVVYISESDFYEFYEGNGGKAALVFALKGKNVVTFNGIKFDSRVILGNARKGVPWNEYDILLEVVRSKYGLDSVESAERKLGDKEVHDGSISLDGLAEGTLGKHKTGHGAKAPILYREKKFDQLYSYNLQDVRLTRQIFEFVLKYGYLIDRNGLKVKMSVPYW